MDSREFDHWVDAVAWARKVAYTTGVRQAVEATIDDDGTLGRSWVASRSFRHPRLPASAGVAPGATDDANGAYRGAEGFGEER